MYICISQEPRLAGPPGEGHSRQGSSALCCAVRGAGVERGLCLWDSALSGWFRRMERNDRAVTGVRLESSSWFVCQARLSDSVSVGLFHAHWRVLLCDCQGGCAVFGLREGGVSTCADCGCVLLPSMLLRPASICCCLFAPIVFSLHAFNASVGSVRLGYLVCSRLREWPLQCNLAAVPL